MIYIVIWSIIGYFVYQNHNAKTLAYYYKYPEKYIDYMAEQNIDASFLDPFDYNTQMSILRFSIVIVVSILGPIVWLKMFTYKEGK